MSVLNKDDKSYKQSIDAPVVSLVEGINESQSFLTTSSCSGRIMMIHEGDVSKRKNGADFLFVSHDLVDPVESKKLVESIKGLSGNVFFKLEPLIIHVECERLDLAVTLLHLMKEKGPFKHSAIVSARNAKFVVAIRGMVRMEIPLIYQGEMMISHDQLKRYLEIANERLKENFEAIRQLKAWVSGGQLDRIGVEQPVDHPIRDLSPALNIVGEIVDGFTALIPTPLLHGSPVEIGELQLKLDDQWKFAMTQHGERIGIVPDGRSRPPTSRCNCMLVGTLPNQALISFDDDLWILVLSEKSSGKHQLNWKKVRGVNAGAQYFTDGTSIQIMSDSIASQIVWGMETSREHEVRVKGFERFGDAIQVEDELSPADAQLYARNMNARIVVKSDKPFTPPTILYSALNSPVVCHRENGVSFKIDFSVDSFSSVLVAQRAKIPSLLQDSEYVCEIAQGVDCLSIALGKVPRVTQVDIIVINQSRYRMIEESMTLNQVEKFKLFTSVEEVMDKSGPIYDRLIISDPAFVVTEDIMSRLVKPGGIVHQIKWRHSKFTMVHSTFNALSS